MNLFPFTVFLFNFLIAIAGLPAFKALPVHHEILANTGNISRTNDKCMKNNGLIEDLMRQHPEYFAKILNNHDALKVQIIYTQIDRNASNAPSFTDYFFNVDSGKYFYPASTVKMPVALLALQRLHELRLPGLNKNSSMITGADYSGQTAVYNDPSTPDGRPTVAQYVKKIFLVSDNDAFNRLYEFLGQEYINERLHKMGYPTIQINHRLEVSMTQDENRHSNPVSFYDPAGKRLYFQPMQFNQRPYLTRNDFVGHGFFRDGKYVDHAMDFSIKNKICLEDLHMILRSLIFPSSVPQNKRFNLNEEDYRFVYQYMSEFPPESKYPFYDSAEYWDAYGKLLYWGSEKGKLPKTIRIFNKEGDAYGFLTDISYFCDFNKHVEFMLSATIYCNSDEILNDDHYDYVETGLPFMKQLGRVIYEYDAGRKRSYTPNLVPFMMNYDQ
ncbi:MAG: serine hydrolase [Chitinophagales bacterium]